MSDYKITNGMSIVRETDGAFIPPDPANRDYADYLSWVEAGGVPDPYIAPTPPTPPTPLEKLQASGLSIADLKGLLGIA